MFQSELAREDALNKQIAWDLPASQIACQKACQKVHLR
jgi:hypothetical protein